jgi:hypothetical protein
MQLTNSGTRVIRVRMMDLRSGGWWVTAVFARERV